MMHRAISTTRCLFCLSELEKGEERRAEQSVYLNQRRTWCDQHSESRGRRIQILRLDVATW